MGLIADAEVARFMRFIHAATVNDDVIVEDIGEGSDGGEFPGASHSVEVR